MNTHTLRVGIDIGSARHRIAVGLPDGKLIDEFDIDHHAAGFQLFFARINPRGQALPLANHSRRWRQHE